MKYALVCSCHTDEDVDKYVDVFGLSEFLESNCQRYLLTMELGHKRGKLHYHALITTTMRTDNLRRSFFRAFPDAVTSISFYVQRLKGKYDAYILKNPLQDLCIVKNYDDDEIYDLRNFALANKDVYLATENERDYKYISSSKLPFLLAQNQINHPITKEQFGYSRPEFIRYMLKIGYNPLPHIRNYESICEMVEALL